MRYLLVISFNIASMEESFGVQESFLIEFNGKTKHRPRKGWTGRPQHHKTKQLFCNSKIQMLTFKILICN